MFTVHIFGQIHCTKNSRLQSTRLGQITNNFGLLYLVMFTVQIRSFFFGQMNLPLLNAMIKVETGCQRKTKGTIFVGI